MNLTVNIEAVDKTSVIDWPSFRIEDVKDYQPNTCSFTIRKHDGQNYIPNIGDEIEVLDGVDKIFAGRIVRVQSKSASKLLFYDIMAKDWTLLLDKIHVTERYTNQSVNDIINDIVTNYLAGDGITTNNVSAPLVLGTVSFSDLPVSKCLQKLAERINYHWYIDYDKDIHFFPKHTENAPFNLDDASGNFIWDSLVIENDLSQLRNKVTIRGAEVESENTRTMTHTGDGAQKTFPTNYKFSAKPTVEVNAVAQVVGTENLEDEAGKDCMWDFNQKYIRFINAPANGVSVDITQKFLYPLYVRVQDDDSIAEFGTYEFKKTDKTIKSAAEARQVGNAELEAYSQSITDARFETRTSGLQSGQTINVNVTDRSINEDYMIQRVSLRMEGPNKGRWSVELATLRTIGIIDLLQSLLINSDKNVDIDEDAVLEKDFIDYQTVQVTEEITRLTPYEDFQTVEVTESIEKDPFGAVEPTWVLARYVPTGHNDPKREMRLGIATLH